MSALEGLPKLRELNLENTPLKNEGLEQIGKMTGLEELSVQYTQINDKGMPALAALKNLRRLNLAGDRHSGMPA